MKKFVLLFTVVLLVTPQITFAENGGSKKDAAMERKAVMSETKALVKDAMAENKADRKAAHEEMKAALKAKLQTLKDEKKKMVAEKLDTKLDTINKTRTAGMTENIAKLSTILEKLRTMSEEKKTAGQDVTSVTAAIAAADKALEDAQTAVDAQAAKDYTAEVTDETTLKKSFGAVVSRLRTDLSATHKTVVDAKKAVKDVAVALRTLKGGETTPALSPTP